MSGFIKIHRKIDEWEWRKKPNTFSLFIYLLTKANYKPTRFQGHFIDRGQLIVGRGELAKSLGISEQSVRTALNHLKSTSELTSKPTNKFTVITVVNYDLYQCADEEPTSKPTSQSTSNQPTTNQQLTTSKERKKERRKEKNIERPDGVPEILWNDFLFHRKQKKAPLTQTALNGICKEADKAGWMLQDALVEMCSRGWIGFKAEWVTKGKENETNIKLSTTERNRLAQQQALKELGVENSGV